MISPTEPDLEGDVLSQPFGRLALILLLQFAGIFIAVALYLIIPTS